MLKNSYLKSQHSDREFVDSEKLIIDYLKKKKLLQTLQTFEKESKHKSYTDTPLHTLKQLFLWGERELFFKLWLQLKQGQSRNTPTQENLKLELFLHIYFVIFPLKQIGGKKAQLQQDDINFFKNFLEEKGEELSKFPEVLPYFALPYFKDIQNHSSFKELFEKKWVENLNKQLDNYLTQNYADLQSKTNLEVLLISMRQKADKNKILMEDSVENVSDQRQKQLEQNLVLQKQLEDKQLELDSFKEQSKNTMKEIHQKWANFVIKIIDVSKGLKLIIESNEVSSHDQEWVQFLTKQLKDYEEFLHSSIEELFFDDNYSDNRVSILNRERNSSLQFLDFKAIKEVLITDSNPQYVCVLLEALRWRISKTKSSLQRREAIIQYTSQDLLDYKLFKLLIEKKSKSINEYLIAFLNSIASEYLGRSFLIENSQLLKHLIFILKNEKKESFIMKNCLGIVQKLSLRKKPQEILIQNDVIKWAINMLTNKKDYLDEYSLEYLTALLLNLSLRTIGKNKFEEIKYTALNLLYEFLNHENSDVQIYVTGTLYSLFSKESIKKLAIEMNFEGKLEKLIEQGEESMSKKYSYVLQQMRSESMENNLSELNEDENDMDLLDEEGLGEEEPNEIPKEIPYLERGDELLEKFKLEGDKAERQFQIVSAIMEETLNQSKLDISKGIKSVTKDSFVLRPSTPLKLPSFNLDQKKGDFTDIKYEKDFAFKPRHKLDF